MVFVPVISSQAGLCLTSHNWQEVHIQNASWSLESLLLKPGLNVLNKILDLKKYLGWHGSLGINAMNLCENKAGEYRLISPYDGSSLQLTPSDLIKLVNHLRPDRMILPKGIMRNYPELWALWPDEVMPFVAHGEYKDEYENRLCGIYLNADDWQKNALHYPKQVARYLVGDFEIDSLNEILGAVEYIETNIPADLALHGKVYSKSELLDILDSSNESNFNIIDDSCSCPTCSQKMTRAYLHHLFQHTPLLCQRMLIQHNVSYFK